MIAARCPTSYPPPPASQPAIEGAQSGGRPWITLPPCQSDTIVNTQATICFPRNPTSATVHVRPKQVFTISEMRNIGMAARKRALAK